MNMHFSALRKLMTSSDLVSSLLVYIGCYFLLQTKNISEPIPSLIPVDIQFLQQLVTKTLNYGLQLDPFAP